MNMSTAITSRFAAAFQLFKQQKCSTGASGASATGASATGVASVSVSVYASASIALASLTFSAPESVMFLTIF